MNDVKKIASSRQGCLGCGSGSALGFAFDMAFQPIVNMTHKKVFAYEALVRGPEGQSAASIFAQVHDGNRYRFDQACRIKAIERASELGLSCLSINFMPNAVYRPEVCIRTTLEAAELYGFPLDRIIFEITESERVEDIVHMRQIVEHYKARGFLTAIDDFGAGYSGLNLLAEVRTDILKLDMALIRGIEQDQVRQIIVRGILQVCRELGVQVIAEGVETVGEWRMLSEIGIELFQGYLFARPAFRSIPTVEWPVEPSEK